MQQDKTEAWGSVGPSADVSALSRTEGERRSDTGIMDQEDNEIVHQSDYGDPGALGSQVVDPLFARLAWDPGEDQQSDAAFPADQGPSALGLFTSRAKVGIDHDKKESTPVLRSQRTRKKWKSALLKVNSTFAIQHSQHEENAARREILKAMNKDVLGNWREEENSTSKLIKMVLGSDKSTEEMVDFIYDRRKLETEIKHLMRVEREERERQRRAEEMRRDHKHKKEEKNQLLLTDPDPPGKHTKSSADLFANNDSPGKLKASSVCLNRMHLFLITSPELTASIFCRGVCRAAWIEKEQTTVSGDGQVLGKTRRESANCCAAYAGSSRLCTEIRKGAHGPRVFEFLHLHASRKCFPVALDNSICTFHSLHCDVGPVEHNVYEPRGRLRERRD
jgi:hypothetical protein